MLRISVGFFGINIFFLVPPVDWLFCIRRAPRSQGALLEVTAPARIFGNISGTLAGHLNVPGRKFGSMLIVNGLS